jgi:dTDP-4-amino-4,6-dideoxygalactose transaminase
VNFEKTTKTIPHSRPALGQEEIRLVTEAIHSGHIAQGKAVGSFEASMAKAIGTKGAVACSSGTSALHLALLAMDVGSEDEVIFPSYVCLALLNAVHYVHATPVLADIDPTTQNMDPDDVKKKLTRRTKAIIVPHMFGLAANLESLLTLGVPIIEDCAQAVGTTYNGRTVGAFGHVAVFSFYATKVITTGEGGMVLSNSKEMLHRVRDLRECDQKDDPGVRYNYKMTDMQAALGIAQLGQLDGFIKARRSIAQRYTEAFSTLPVVLPPRDDGPETMGTSTTDTSSGWKTMQGQ